MRHDFNALVQGNGTVGYRTLVRDYYGDPEHGVPGTKQEAASAVKTLVALKYIGIGILIATSIIASDSLGLLDLLLRLS